MPDFHFQSITNTGEVKSGILKGRDRSDVLQQLMSRGETATEVHKLKRTEKVAAGTSRKRKMSKAEMTAHDS